MNLEPDTVYKIELRAHNSIGHSSPAQIKIKTARGKDRNYFSYAHSGTDIITYNNSLICVLLLFNFFRH